MISTSPINNHFVNVMEYLVTQVITYISIGLTLSSICNTLTATKPLLIYTYPLTTTRTTATCIQVQMFEFL